VGRSPLTAANVSRRVLLALAVALSGAALVGAVAVVAAGTGDDGDAAGGGGSAAATAEVRLPDLRECRRLGADLAKECYTSAYVRLVRGRRDPRPAVKAIADNAWKEGASLLADCHGIMHTVGRTYATERHLTLGALMDYLPRSNDPGCTAGFAHGMISAMAPDIDPSRPGEAARVCGDARTRYQEYSCIHGFGHAFMRIYAERLVPALHLCALLGKRAAADCAQGAYHDYWFAVIGADDTSLQGEPVRDPRRLCGDAPARFVRPCWYRVWLENRTQDLQVGTPADIEALCSGLSGLQRSACVTAAALIGPADPAAQLALCARMPAAADQASCARATKVQNLLGKPAAAFVPIVNGCSRFAAAAQAPCYRWLGKAVAVLTDEEFARAGCPRLRGAAARRECAAGARTMNQALQTFS
jgi:hypothetical protein